MSGIDLGTIGATLSGLTSGFTTGYKISSDIQENQLKKDIYKLSLITEARKAKMEEQKQAAEAEQRKWENTLKLGTEYTKNLSTINDPESKKIYVEQMKDSPFVKNAPAELKSYFTIMSNNNVAQVEAMSKSFEQLEKARSAGDIDGQYAAYSKLVAMTGKDAPEPISKVLSTIGDSLFPKKEASSPLGKLINEQKRYAPGTPEYNAYEQMKQKETTHARGGATTNIYTGDMTKTTQTDVQKKTMASQNLMDTLYEIKEMTKNPSTMNYLNATGAVKGALIDLKQKFNMPVSEMDEKSYGDYVSMTSKLLQGITPLRHEYYGAALTATEKPIIEAQWPNIQTESSWKQFLHGDSGKKFITKLDATIDVQEQIAERLEKARTTGKIIYDRSGQPKEFLDENGNPMYLPGIGKSSSKKGVSQTNSTKKPPVYTRDKVIMEMQEARPDLPRQIIEQEADKYLQYIGR
jgi:hypothetical protein